MENFLWKNGQLIAEKKAQISIHERGFLFGDGLFETCKIIDGKIFDFSAHQARINKALSVLKISAETSDLEKKSYQLIKKNCVQNGILRISISRGIGSKGFLPTNESEALIIIETSPPRLLPKKIRLGISSQIAPKNFGFKAMSALPYVLCKLEAEEKKLFDCVMLSEKKFISETSSANIFWVKNGKIFTPSKKCDILAGTLRQRLLALKEKIFEVEANISELKNADEIFLTNSSFLLASVDEFIFKKGDKIAVKKLEKKFAKKINLLLKSEI